MPPYFAISQNFLYNIYEIKEGEELYGKLL